MSNPKRYSKKLEPSLSAKGVGQQVSKKLHKTKSITSAGLRRSINTRTNDLVRISRGSNDHYDRVYEPEKFEPKALRNPASEEATDFKSKEFDAKYCLLEPIYCDIYN